MEKQVYHKKDQLIKIVVSDFEQSDWYKYKKEVKIFGYKIFDACIKTFYSFGESQSINDFLLEEEHLCIINEKVYKKPKVKLFFKEDHSITVFKETLSDAISFAKSFVNETDWIIIELNK